MEQVPQATQLPRWSLASRVAFRFCFAYFGMFCFTEQILGDLARFPKFSLPNAATIWPMRDITFWAARHVFGVTQRLIYTGSGSGDKTFDWVGAFCLLFIAVLTTAAWSVLDGNRPNYVILHKWFRLFVRFALAAEMFSYGMAKVIPLQMPFPFLTRLVEPFGNFTPDGILWYSIGSSPAYEIFSGCAEMLGGILLVLPRTTMLGALICLAELIQVFVLNMTYDVPVKLFSFHLLLLAVFLLAPELPRFASFFFLDRVTEPSKQPQLFRTWRANRIALAAQIIFGVYLIGINVYSSWNGWYAYGDGRVKSPLYGIWDVDQFSIDGQLRSPLLTDSDRWRRVIFDFPTSMNVQSMDDSIAGYGASINLQDKTILLPIWDAKFTFQRPVQNQLILDGDIDHHKVHMQLQLVDRNKFPIVSRGFHWIEEYPFVRQEVRR